MVVPTPFVASTMSAIRDKLRPDQARPLLRSPILTGRVSGSESNQHCVHHALPG